MKLSIVTTLYMSSEYVNDFHVRASAAASSVASDSYEIIYVDDGSPDNSLDVAVEIAKSDSKCVVVELSRNFGHHKAMMTGMMHASGDRVFLVDSDLEESPEWLLEFNDDMMQTGCDVVYGIQQERKGGLFERMSGRLFYRLFNSLSGMDIPENVVTARLMTRDYVEALLQHDEREIFIAGLWYITGFRQHAHVVEKLGTSESSYSLRKKLSMFVSSVTSFTNAPLIWIFYLGVVLLCSSGIYISYLVINWLFYARPVSGWTSVMASIWLFGGLTISMTGVVGIYLAKVYTESKKRPYTIVRNVYSREDRVAGE